MAKPRLNRLKVILVEFEFSQKELAKQLDLNEQSVSRWCRNIHQPSLDQIYEIARFFRIDNRRLLEPTTWEQEEGPAPYELVMAARQQEKADRKKAAAKAKRKKK